MTYFEELGWIPTMDDVTRPERMRLPFLVIAVVAWAILFVSVVVWL